MKFRVYFNVHDCWVGVYWRRTEVYVCLLPMVVLWVQWA